MNDVQREQLQATLHRIQRRWGAHAIVRAGSRPAGADGIPTGFPELDRVVPHGVPLHAITLLSGSATCGKVTLAYHILAHAQRAAGGLPAALVDLNGSTDADYLARCEVDLERLLVVRPRSAADTGRVLLDLIRTRELRAILVDNLAEAGRSLDPFLAQLNFVLKGTPTALVILDEIQPPWLPPDGTRAAAPQAALHIKLARQAWIETDGELTGYHVQATANCKGVIRESTRITRMETLLIANP